METASSCQHYVGVFSTLMSFGGNGVQNDLTFKMIMLTSLKSPADDQRCKSC